MKKDTTAVFSWSAGKGMPSDVRELRSGALTMRYENGNLRYIKSGKTELLRMIYSAVRDRDWLTPAPVITGEKIESDESSFTISYSAEYKKADIHFVADCSIKGDDNSIIFSFRGEARSEFQKNRIGFCVLHPITGNAGKKCTIIHPDGSSTESEFPEAISPHQPFKNISSMLWEADGNKCRLDFEGDIFETEDQRNWTDASYKTYCTPLERPFPVMMSIGDRIDQKIRFHCEPAFASSSEEKIIEISLSEKSMPLPQIGVCRSTRNSVLSDKETGILRKISFDHYRAELYLFNDNWKQEADDSTGEAERLGFALRFALFFDDAASDQVQAFAGWVSERKPRIREIMIFHGRSKATPENLIDLVVPVLKQVLPGAKIITGTNANFAQLNRTRLVSPQVDALCYAIHPQEHASDNLTMIENMQAQADTVESTGKFSRGKEIHAGPVNLIRRFNAGKETYEHPHEDTMLPPQVDSRILSVFGACWTTGSLKYLISAGVDSITYYETAGERGIIQGNYPSRWPGQFPAADGMIFPVYHVFRLILNNSNYNVAESRSSNPLKVEVLALKLQKSFRLFISNFTSEPQEVKLTIPSGELKIRTLDHSSIQKCYNDPDWFFNTEFRIINEGEKLIFDPFSLNIVDF